MEKDRKRKKVSCGAVQGHHQGSFSSVNNRLKDQSIFFSFRCFESVCEDQIIEAAQSEKNYQTVIDLLCPEHRPKGPKHSAIISYSFTRMAKNINYVNYARNHTLGKPDKSERGARISLLGISPIGLYATLPSPPFF